MASRSAGARTRCATRPWRGALRCAIVLPAAGAIVLAWGCQSLEQRVPPVGPPIVDAGQAAGASPAGLERGRAIYLDRCTRCHSAEAIDRYDAEKWRARILPEMIKRSKLDAAQAGDLTAYVMAARAVAVR